MGFETEQIKRPAPTLYFIIAIKLFKGISFVTLAIVMYSLADNDLPAELHRLLDYLRFNPERKFWVDLARQLGQLTETKVVLTAVGTFVYSLFSLVEGIGLIFRVSWAGWMAIGESAFFIPIEIYELVRPPNMDHPGHPKTVFIILVLNVVIVWYLFQNRKRLFRHHHH